MIITTKITIINRNIKYANHNRHDKQDERIECVAHGKVGKGKRKNFIWFVDISKPAHKKVYNRRFSSHQQATTYRCTYLECSIYWRIWRQRQKWKHAFKFYDVETHMLICVCVSDKEEYEWKMSVQIRCTSQRWWWAYAWLK